MSTETHDAEGTLLSQKPANVLKVPSEEEVIPPGVTAQLVVKLGMEGTLLGVALGPAAKPHKLFAGKHQLDVPEDVTVWRPNIPVKAGAFVILTVENVSDEPAVFRALFFIDAPGHQVVVGAPQAPPPLQPIVTHSAPRPAAHMGLTTALPPEPRSTPADHGLKPGANEVALVLMRNDVAVLLDHLRTNTPLVPNTRHAVIRRLDVALKDAK